MRVSDIVNSAVKGELKPIYLSDIGVEGSRTEDQQSNLDSILDFINQGLIDLYKRYPLLTRELLYTLTAGDSNGYELPEDFLNPISAVTDTGEALVFGEDRGNTLSILFPAPGHILLKGDFKPEVKQISLVYSILPPLANDLEDELVLPYVYLDPLLKFVAYKGYSSISNSNQKPESFNYLQSYYTSLEFINNNGLNLPDSIYNDKLYSRGFV